jgi:hypothetical protein
MKLFNLAALKKFQGMKAAVMNFNHIIETIYNLPLADRIQIITLLEHNIADTRRNEIAKNYKNTQLENKANKLKFSSKLYELKKML